MNYEYCGMVFASDIDFPFFNKSEAKPNYYIVKGKKSQTFSNMPAVFYDGMYYVVNFGENGYYMISNNIITCNFNDFALVKATICNIPMAIIMLLNDLLPIHCSSIVSRSGNDVILLAGPKGMGKTTLAYYFNKYMHYDIFGDDVVSALNIEHCKMMINRGTIAMKLCGDLISKDLLISPPKHLEVYDGWDKYYYFPNKYKNFQTTLPIRDLYILRRGRTLEKSRVPDFLIKPSILNNIVGISYLETLFSSKICDMINRITYRNLSTLTIPTGLDDFKNRLEQVAQIMEESS